MNHRRRAWRRVFIWLVASVVLGAATTVAVAWGECLREPPSLAVYFMHGGGWFGAPPALGTIGACNWPQGPPAGVTPRKMTIHSPGVFGWPRPALVRQIEWSYLLSVERAWQGVTGYRVEHGLETPLKIGALVTPNSSRPLHRVLPTKPLWRGFAFNMTVFGLGWFAMLVLLAAPAALRRRRRARLGLCVGCGYDLRHSAGVCPECGQTIETIGAKEEVRCAAADSGGTVKSDGTSPGGAT